MLKALEKSTIYWQTFCCKPGLCFGLELYLSGLQAVWDLDWLIPALAPNAAFSPCLLNKEREPCSFILFSARTYRWMLTGINSKNLHLLSICYVSQGFMHLSRTRTLWCIIIFLLFTWGHWSTNRSSTRSKIINLVEQHLNPTALS